MYSCVPIHGMDVTDSPVMINRRKSARLYIQEGPVSMITVGVCVCVYVFVCRYFFMKLTYVFILHAYMDVHVNIYIMFNQSKPWIKSTSVYNHHNLITLYSIQYLLSTCFYKYVFIKQLFLCCTVATMTHPHMLCNYWLLDHFHLQFSEKKFNWRMYIQDITAIHNFYALKVMPIVESKNSFYCRKLCICKIAWWNFFPKELFV